jgi:hypothetical protein
MGRTYAGLGVFTNAERSISAYSRRMYRISLWLSHELSKGERERERGIVVYIQYRTAMGVEVVKFVRWYSENCTKEPHLVHTSNLQLSGADSANHSFIAKATL